MYYLFLGTGTFSSPELLIAFYDGKYYSIKQHYNWEFLDVTRVNDLKHGVEGYYMIEEEQFLTISKRWGVNPFGYRNVDTTGYINDIGYGEE